MNLLKISLLSIFLFGCGNSDKGKAYVTSQKGGISVIDFDLLAKMLLRLDQLGFNLQELYTHTQPNPLYFNQEDMLYARLIVSDDITCFTDLILY